MSVELLTKQHLEFLSLTGGCTGSSEYTLVKMPHCWKSSHGSFVIEFEQFYSAIHVLSHDVASGCDITPCNKIDKPLWFTDFGNLMK